MCRHKPGFCIRTQSGLTVQLHQILPISKRRQGLYKHCPPRHSDSAICIDILPLSPDGFPELRMPSRHKNSGTLLFSHVLCGSYLHQEPMMLSERNRCGGLITEQLLPPSARNILPEAATARARLNTARWTRVSTVMRILLQRLSGKGRKVEPQDLLSVPTASAKSLSLSTPREQSLGTGGPSALSH